MAIIIINIINIIFIFIIIILNNINIILTIIIIVVSDRVCQQSSFQILILRLFCSKLRQIALFHAQSVCFKDVADFMCPLI